MAEAVVLLLLDERVSRVLVDASSGMEHAVGPEHDLAVARLAGEARALIHESRADAEAARLRVDEQEPQLRDSAGLLHEEHAAPVHAIPFGDPAALPFRVEDRKSTRLNSSH